MKNSGFWIGLLLAMLPLSWLAGQAVSAGWKVVKDDKGRCQIAFPPEWSAASVNAGAALAQNPTHGSLVVTSDPFTLKPMPEPMQKAMKVGKMFENTEKRVFCSTQAGNLTSCNLSVPGKTGTCIAMVTFSPSVAEGTAKSIVLSLGPVK